MSDIVETIAEYLSMGGLFNPEMMEHDTVRNLIIECRAEITRLRVENERLREALKECEEELDAYYHQEYPTDHPYHQRKLKAALQGNPARAALKENSDE